MLRHVVVREGIATGQVLVVLVTAAGAEEGVNAAAERIAAAHPEVVGVLHAVNAGVAETTAGHPTRLVTGRDWLEERVQGATLRLSAGSFFQTNTRMAERLYERVAEAAGLDGSQVLYDLFSGAGSIGVVLARGAREVVAIDVVPEAVEDAARNAAANGLANHTALCGDVGVVLRERRGELPPPDVAVVNPPRAGLSGRAVRRVLELAPPTLVYVSCQPATFADNAARFVAGGYRLEWVRPVEHVPPDAPHRGGRPLHEGSALAVELRHQRLGVAGAGGGPGGHGVLEAGEVSAAELQLERPQRLGQALAGARPDQRHDVVAARQRPMRSPTWAEVAPAASATSRKRSTRARLRSRFSPWKRGAWRAEVARRQVRARGSSGRSAGRARARRRR